MERETLFTLACVILGLVAIIYGALGWIVSHVLQLFGLKVVIQGLGLRSAGRIAIQVNQLCCIEIFDLSLGLGAALPWAPKSRLFSLVIGRIAVSLKLPEDGSAASSPTAEGSRHTQAAASSAKPSDSTSPSKYSVAKATVQHSLLVRTVVFLLRFVDVIVRQVVVEVSSSNPASPVLLEVKVDSGMRVDFTSKQRKLLARLSVHNVEANLLLGEMKTSLADLHLAVCIQLELCLDKPILPLSSVKVALQSPSFSLQDCAVESFQSILPVLKSKSPSPPTAQQQSAVLASSGVPDKLAAMSAKLCKLLPHLLELSVEESNGKFSAQAGRRECDLQLSKVLLSIKRHDNNMITIQPPSASSASLSSSMPADSCVPQLPSCEASLMFCGIALRLGERPPILSLQRMQLTAKAVADDSTSAASHATRQHTACTVSTSLSVESLQACYWHTEMKHWLALLPKKTAGPSPGQLPSGAGRDAVPAKKPAQKLQHLLCRLPSALKLRASVSVSDISLGIVSLPQLNISTIEKPQCRAVLAAANLQADIDQETRIGDGRAGSRSLQASCRLEGGYVYNSQIESALSQSSHFHPKNLLCPLPGKVAPPPPTAAVAAAAVAAAAAAAASSASSSPSPSPTSESPASGSHGDSGVGESCTQSTTGAQRQLWASADDPSVLPSSGQHVYGRPLELAGISCKVTVQLPTTSMTSPSTASSALPQALSRTGESRRPVSLTVAVDVCHFNLELSRPLLASACHCVDEMRSSLQPLLSKSQRSQQGDQNVDGSGGSAVSDSTDSLPSVLVQARLLLSDVNIIALQNEPGPAMGLVQLSSFCLTHSPGPQDNAATAAAAAAAADKFPTTEHLVDGSSRQSSQQQQQIESSDPASGSEEQSDSAEASTPGSDVSGSDTVGSDTVTNGDGDGDGMAFLSTGTSPHASVPTTPTSSSSSSCPAADAESIPTGLAVNVRGATVSTLSADDNKKVLALQNLSSLTHSVLSVDKIALSKCGKSVDGELPEVYINWTASSHKTFTVLAEQLVADLLHLKARLPLPSSASSPADTSPSTSFQSTGESVAPAASAKKSSEAIPEVVVDIGLVSLHAQLDPDCCMLAEAKQLSLTNRVRSRSPTPTAFDSSGIVTDTTESPATSSSIALGADCSQPSATKPSRSEGDTDAGVPSDKDQQRISADGLLRGFHVLAGSVVWGFDDHEIVQLQNVVLSSPNDVTVNARRAAFPSFSPKNERSALQLAVNVASVCMPYHYNFGAATDKLIGVFKLLKTLHKKGPATKSGLGPDLLLKVEDFTLELSDDPFEVKLGDNYALIRDENSEMQKRRKLLETRIMQIRSAVGEMQAARKLDEFLEALERTNSQVYCSRSKLLYDCVPMRTALLKVTAHCVEVAALADASLQGVDNELAEMRRIDSDSPFPEGLQFSTLWARKVQASSAQLQAHLRDYSQPLAIVDQLSISGALVGAEEEATASALRSGVVHVGAPWDSVTVLRSMPSLKFYHDLEIDAENIVATYGTCWEAVLGQVSCAADVLTKESADPSLPLPFWDKIRLLLHGHARLKSEQILLFLIASSNPHNVPEKLEIVIKSLVLTLSNALMVVQGDLDAYTRTASKYDECHIIHVPSVKTSINLLWECDGDSNDHHSIMPCAPDKVKTRTVQEHDSFAGFRSNRLSLNIDVDIAADQHQIKSFLYGTSLRFFQKMQTVYQMVTTPIRRGKLFSNTKPRKPTLSRFFKNLTIEGSMPSLHLLYWNSYACARGISSHFGPITNHIKLLVSSQAVADMLDEHGAERKPESLGNIGEESLEDDASQHSDCVAAPLIRRPASVWNIRSAKTVVDGVAMDTYENTGSKGTATAIDASQPENFAERHELLSVGRLEYFHEDDAKCKQSQDSQDKCYTHRLMVNELKGLWTFENRMVVFGLYDSYAQANVLKADLSAESLIGLRSGQEELNDGLAEGVFVGGDSAAESASIASSSSYDSLGFTGYSAARQSSSTSSFPLLEQLINDRDSKFTAEADEDRGEHGTPQLFGHKLCRADDLRELSWLIEFANAQVVFKAPTMDGCVAVTTSSAVIMAHVHTPVVQRGELVAKTTWTSLINDMQYFASVDVISGKSLWLPDSALAQAGDPMNSEQHAAPRAGNLDIGNLLGGEYTASSNKLSAMLSTVGDSTAARISPFHTCVAPLAEMQVQRLVARCVCQVHYASFGGRPDPAHIPKTDASLSGSRLLLSERKRAGLRAGFSTTEEPVDTFTISYPKVELATNAEQYKLVLDIITQLLFYVDPKNKELADRCENKRFELSLSNIVDQRTPVMEKQRSVRQELEQVRALDRRTYDLWQDMDLLCEQRRNICDTVGGFGTGGLALTAGLSEVNAGSLMEIEEALADYQQEAGALEVSIAEAKTSLTEKSLDLRVTLNSFRASQLGLQQGSEETRQSASIERRIEVWLDNSTWTIMQADGQLEFAKVSLSNFLYAKITKTDGSGSHQFDLGWFLVQNLLPLLPSETYRDALKPSQENVKVERSKSLRVLLVEQAAVGGISVKEHFEVNIVPLNVHVTGRFYESARQFFFDEDANETPPSSLHSNSSASAVHSGAASAALLQASTSSSSSGSGQPMAPTGGTTTASSSSTAAAAGVGATTSSLAVASAAGAGTPDNMSLQVDWDDDTASIADGSGLSSKRPGAAKPSRGSMRRKSKLDDGDAPISKSRPSSSRRHKPLGNRSARDDIETMKARASLNKTFTYIKVPQVQLIFSFKDESWLELEDAVLTLPTIEYHNCTFTYHDLLMQIKREVKIVIIPQAIKQKLHISRNTGFSDHSSDKSDKSTLLGGKVGKDLNRASRRLFSKISRQPRASSLSQLTAPSGDEVPQVAEEGEIRQPVNFQDMIEELSRIEESTSSVSSSPTSVLP